MKPKILVVDIGGWGGIAHYTYNLMKAVARNASVDSALLTDSQYELDGLQRNFQVIKKPLRDQPYGAALRSVLEAVREYAPDAVHVQTMISARRDWIWFLLAALRRFPVIVTAHNILPHDEPEQRALFMKTAFRVIYRSASGIIVHSEYAKERLKEFAGASGMRIAVIPHGNYLFFKRALSRRRRRASGWALPRGLQYCCISGRCAIIRELKTFWTFFRAYCQGIRMRSFFWRVNPCTAPRVFQSVHRGTGACRSRRVP
jgi:glycosyltransferase involved in cell wall biosynthesis